MPPGSTVARQIRLRMNCRPYDKLLSSDEPEKNVFAFRSTSSRRGLLLKAVALPLLIPVTLSIRRGVVRSLLKPIRWSGMSVSAYRAVKTVRDDHTALNRSEE